MIAARQKYQCSECHQVLGPIWEIDHIKALCHGGSNEWSNLTVLCLGCHGLKTSHDTRIYYDRLEEQRTGKSRFFNPMAAEYCVPGNRVR